MHRISETATPTQAMTPCHLLNVCRDGLGAAGRLFEIVGHLQSVIELFDLAKVILRREAAARPVLGPLMLNQLRSRHDRHHVIHRR